MEDLDQSAALRREADRVRAANGLGRSGMLLRLFDYLLLRSLAGQSPKEIEIAHEVFSRNSSAEVGDDSSVRVYIHRLRRKLMEFYESSGKSSDGRLTIPLGDYRLALIAPDEGVDADKALIETNAPSGNRATGPWTRRAFAGAGVAALLSAGAGLQMLREASDDLSAVRKSPLWRRTSAADRPTLIIVGDYYIFGEAPNGTEVSRLIREFSINSREDLDEFLMSHPNYSGRYVGLDLSYSPMGAVSALGTLMPLFTNGQRRPAVMPASAVTVRMLRFFHIVYIGYLSGLGPLRDELFGVSRFKVGDSYDELIDDVTGRHYRADWEVVARGGTPRRDYAYLATFPGPHMNNITVIAGTRDAALMQAAEIAVDASQLEQIARAGGAGPYFEALFQVRSLANANIDGTLLVAAPLKSATMWRGDKTSALRFPDDRPR